MKNNLDQHSYIYLKKSFGELDLYEVDDKFFLPQIYASLNTVLVTGGIEGMLGVIISNGLTSSKSVLFLSNQLNSHQTQFLESYDNTVIVFDNNVPRITFQKINPTKYIVNVNASKPFFLVFSESYHKDWVAYIDGRRIPNEYHFMANGYANAWYINKTGSYDIILEFWPQKLFYVGSAISIITLISCVFYIGKDKIKALYPRHAKKKQ